MGGGGGCDAQHLAVATNDILAAVDALRAEGRELNPPERIDFSMISDEFPPFEEFPRGPLNRIDVQTAVEFYTQIKTSYSAG